VESIVEGLTVFNGTEIPSLRAQLCGRAATSLPIYVTSARVVGLVWGGLLYEFGVSRPCESLRDL